MSEEQIRVSQSLQSFFSSASNIYVDPETKECEVTVSVDEFQGEISGYLHESGVKLQMVDYCDTYPFKYVFNYLVLN